MQEQPRRIYRSMQGREVDITKLFNQNEMTVAVGNIGVNARGDELGAGGKILKRREDVIGRGSVPDQVNVRTAPVNITEKKVQETKSQPVSQPPRRKPVSSANEGQPE